MKKITIILLVLILVPQLAFAQNPCQGGTGANLGTCVTTIYKWSLAIAALIAILAMVMGGYQVMTAGGDAEQATSGKGYIMSAVVGLCLLISAYLILNTINPQLVNFRDFTTDPFQTPAGPGPSPGSFTR